VIDRLLPSVVAAAETRADLVDIELFPEEERCIDRAVQKRRREFVTGRACARSALEKLGIAPAAIARGAHGEPLWMAGIVGSITHCSGYRACAVARAEEVALLGIDAEPNAPVPERALTRIAVGSEREIVAPGATTDGDQPVFLDRLLFSAKEAVYKAWFPLTERALGFEEMEVSLDQRDRTFRARLRVPGPVVDGVSLTELRGRWCVDAGVLCTAVVMLR
jgi:4'-phosphopantetheinyl transferase EntD